MKRRSMIKAGLIGAQGTGKTTTAALVSRMCRLHFIETHLSEVFDAERTTLGQMLRSPLLDQLAMQEKMIQHLEKQIQPYNGGFISDRTFIDIAAYSLSLVPSDLRDDCFESQKLKRIVQTCLTLEKLYFNDRILLSPGIQLTEVAKSRKNRGQLDWVMVDRITAYSRSLLIQNHPDALFVPDVMLDLSDRTNFIAHHLVGAQGDTLTPIRMR